jgi:glycolate oxidase
MVSSPSLPRQFLRKLRRVVGRRNLLTEPHQLYAHAYDATNRIYQPQAVVRITEREQVSKVLRLATEYGVPVVPRGAGSGFSGGSLPARGGIVLLLDRLNRILEISPERREAVVEPGVITVELQQAVEEQGLFYPPDPASLKFCTLGGNYAENAGGPRCVSYGVTADWVKSALVALPGGEVIDTADDPGLTALFAASEGTLGVTLELRLHLIDKPPASATLRARFPTMVAAAKAVSAIIAAGLTPAKLEFMDAETLRCVATYRNEEPPLPDEAVLLVELDGTADSVAGQIPKIERLCQKLGAVEVLHATDAAGQERLWELRRSSSGAIAGLKPLKVNEDVVVPIGRLPEIVATIDSLRVELRLLIPVFGHAGDGNLHVNIMCDPADKGEMSRVEQALDRLFTAVLALGGTLSGEHGVGLSKQPFIERELSPAIIALSRRIKQRFDRAGILNPGKQFPTSAGNLGTEG